MTVVKYVPKHHYKALLAMLAARRSYLPSMHEMPKYGYVALDGGLIVAMAFLRRVEGGFGQLDGLTSNPEASSEQRDAGIDLVVTHVLTKAQSLRLSVVIATSEDNGTIMRSQKHGFKKSPLTALVVDLNNWREHK